VFDLSIPKLLVLAVIALVIFGPNELPRMAAQAGKALRDLRRIADNAKSDLREGLGPEFQDFDFDDLNPKSFVRKHLMDDFEASINGTTNGTTTETPNGSIARAAQATATRASTDMLAPGETPPYDLEAT
jgi:sec-independent protein translocase protein TatB